MGLIDYILIGVIIVLLVYFFVYVRPKLKHREQINFDIINSNKEVQRELEQKYASLDQLETSCALLNKDITNLTEQKKQISDDLLYQQEKTREAAQSYYKTTMQLSEERVERGLQDLTAKYKQAEEDYKKEYEQLMLDLTSTYEENETRTFQQTALLTTQLEDLKRKVQAAVDNEKREQQKKDNIKFFQLQLTDLDVQEIKRLREVTAFLRQAEPINKVIYKVYYEKPYTDLVGRVIGPGRKCGIYKITNLSNGMCYIGQSVNIAERWRQHIRRGVGADTPTNNKLYPIMYSLGPENFSWEVIEECSQDKLNEREDYWQDYFKAKEYGYSIQ